MADQFDITQLLGGGVPAGLLTPEQEAAAQQRAQAAGLLNFAFGALQASRGVPGQRAPSLGQIIGQAGPVGMAGYQQSFDQTLANALRGMQIQDMQRQRQEMERQRRARETFEQQISGATRTLPTQEAFVAQQSNIEPGQLEGMSAQEVAQQAVAAGLPTRQVVNQELADQAVLNYLRTSSPIEYAKLVAREPKQLPADMQGYQLAVSQGYKGTFLDYQQDLRRAGATNVSVSTEKSYGGAIAGEVAKADAAKFEAANAAPRVIETIQDTRRLLDSGQVITGIGAQQRLDLARFGQLLGVGGKNTNEIVANTQQLFANRAQATLDSIRSSGLGAGQGFSNKDREFLENARLGNITYSPEALRRQLDIEEKVARASVQSWNSRLRNIPQDARTSLGLGEIQLPAATSAPAPARILRFNPNTGRAE